MTESTMKSAEAINELVASVFQQAKNQGKYATEPTIAPLLLHTIGEAIEAHNAFASDNRCDKQDIDALCKMLDSNDITTFYKYFKATAKSTFEDELADIVLMIFSIAGYYGINLGEHILLKHAYNRVRAEHSVANNYDK